MQSLLKEKETALQENDEKMKDLQVTVADGAHTIDFVCLLGRGLLLGGRAVA